MRDLAKVCLTAIFSLLAVIICCLMCFSCKGIQYIPVESIKTEYQYRDRLRRDSIYVHDSIFMFMKGDTIFRDRWHTVYKNNIVYDTAYVNIVDTIHVPYPIEKQLSRWESVKQELGGWLLGAVFVLVLVIASKSIYKFRKCFR